MGERSDAQCFCRLQHTDPHLWYLTRLGLYACNVRQARTLTFAFVLNQAVGAIPRQAEHTPRVIDTAIIDTATVWDGEAGFMSLTADRDMDKDCGGGAGEDLPCTWVGSLFSPQHDCLLTGLALNLRVVDGESLAFRVIVTEWIPTTLAAAGPAATPPDQGRGTSLHQAQDHVCNAGGGPGAVLFYSRVLHIQRQHAEDPVWARIDDALTQTHGQSVRVPAGQTVLLGVCTECVAQEPPVATASTHGEGSTFKPPSPPCRRIMLCRMPTPAPAPPPRRPAVACPTSRPPPGH